MKPIVITKQCEAITLRRGANTQCKHMTLHGTKCWQHEQADDHFRIKQSTVGTDKGLFTTVPIEKGEPICLFTGEKIINEDPNYYNEFALKIRNKPRTFIDARRTDTEEGR
jgi:hypothetical protein